MHIGLKVQIIVSRCISQDMSYVVLHNVAKHLHVTDVHVFTWFEIEVPHYRKKLVTNHIFGNY